LYQGTDSFDHIHWCSPTAHVDPKVLSTLGKKNVTLHEGVPLDLITESIETTIQAFDDLPRYTRAWKRFIRPSDPDDVLSSLSPEDMDILNRHDFESPRRFPHGRPTTCVVIDDFLGDPRVFGTHMSSALNRFVVRLRHRRCSLFLSVQSFTQTIPPSLRSMVNVAILFRCSNSRIRKDIAESLCGGDTTPDRFLDLWEEAVSEDPHVPFVVMHGAPPGTRMRRGLNHAFTENPVKTTQRATRGRPLAAPS
jgi:hypothetical protein